MTAVDQLANKAKAIAAFLGAVLTFTVTLTALPDWVGAIGIVLTFVAVYQVPNKPLPEDI